MCVLPLLALMLPGCTIKRDSDGFSVSPSQDGPPGPPPGAPMADAIPPPANLGLGPSALAGTSPPAFRPRGNRPLGDLSGSYTGSGSNTRDIGGMCASTIRVDNFSVTGNQVSFGSFNGTIAPDGSVSMDAGATRLYGAFHPDGVFRGQFWAPPPTCTYAIALTRQG